MGVYSKQQGSIEIASHYFRMRQASHSLYAAFQNNSTTITFFLLFKQLYFSNNYG